MSHRIIRRLDHIKTRHHVLAAATTGFCDFTRRNGGIPQRVLRRVGLSEEQLIDIDRPLDLGSYVRMLEIAARDTDNDNFGLSFGQQFKPEMLGLIGAVAIYSPTLGSALSSFAKLFPYHQQGTHTAFTSQGQRVRLEYRIMDGSIIDRRHDAELTLGMFVNVLRHCLGGAWAPEAIHFEHPRPGRWREHGKAFSAPIQYGQRTNALVFRNDQLHQSMPLGDLRLANLHSERLMRISGGTGILLLEDHVKGEIRSCLPERVPTVDAIANAVGVARWTLQRRLANHGLSFSGLIDLVRRELAERHIHQRYVPLSAISDVLGYSELSAFSRAFRRWFGLSPQQARGHLCTEQASGRDEINSHCS